MKWLVLVVVLLSVAFYAASALGRLSPERARALVEEGATLVDVRTDGEFAEGHIPGAVNIPVDELESRLKEVGPKDKAVVLYCRSGSRSARAARILQREGFREVHDLGGMSRWR